MTTKKMAPNAALARAIPAPDPPESCMSFEHCRLPESTRSGPVQPLVGILCRPERLASSILRHPFGRRGLTNE